MYGTKRPGFAMILAIFIVVLVSLGGVMLLSSASIGSKSMGDKYLRMQAELLADSATEFALMQVQGFNTAGGNCLENLNITIQDSLGNPMFDANISMAYSFTGNAPGAPTLCTLPHTLATINGTGKTRVLIDTTVTTRLDSNLSTEPIRVFKRSWQTL